MDPRTPPAALDAACLRLLVSCGTGRLVFTRHALPDVVPVRILAAEPHAVLVRLPALDHVAAKDLAGKLDGSFVALHADELDPASLTGASALLHGRARVRADGCLDILPELLTGREFRHLEVTDG